MKVEVPSSQLWMWEPFTQSPHSNSGIVMCVTEDQSMIAEIQYMIKQIRNDFKSNISISLAHCAELSMSTTEKMRAMTSVFVEDICASASKAQKQKLRSWFCKPAALAKSCYQQTMLIDTDLIWLKSPDLLFSAPSFVETGSLFFRDRILFENPSEKDGLEFFNVMSLLAEHGITVTDDIASKLHDSSGFSYYWRHAMNATFRPLRHLQESSVVLMDKLKMSKTISLLKQLVPSFTLGYGDKEIYWLAATLAGDHYSFEPYLSGSYGDCGEIVHFDPTVPPSAQQRPDVFFINGQYLTQDITRVGKGIKDTVTLPIAARRDTVIVEMGAHDRSTGGRCGACAAMGCEIAPPHIKESIIQLQTYMHKHAPAPPSKIAKRIVKLWKRIKYNFT